MSDSNSFRTIKAVRSDQDKPITVPNEIDSFKALLVRQAKAMHASVGTNQVYLLSFHDDGVIWGKLDDQQELRTSDEVIEGNSVNGGSSSPPFRLETLHECRLFSKRGELLIWRTSETDFTGRLITDDESQLEKRTEYYDEPQVLWGTEIDREFTSTTEDFTVVREGQGVRHAFPMKVAEDSFNTSKTDQKKRPLRLYVRHYLYYDDEGCVQVTLSRLLRLSVGESKAGEETR